MSEQVNRNNIVRTSRRTPRTRAHARKTLYMHDPCSLPPRPSPNNPRPCHTLARSTYRLMWRRRIRIVQPARQYPTTTTMSEQDDVHHARSQGPVSSFSLLPPPLDHPLFLTVTKNKVSISPANPTIPNSNNNVRTVDARHARAHMTCAWPARGPFVVRSCTHWCECCVCAVSGLGATYAVAVAGAVGLPVAVDAVGALVIPLTELAKTAAAR
jgi:hypothetical protein